jgi:hypothetical protein
LPNPPLPTKREEPDDPKPETEIQKEYSHDYLYSASLGAVTKITVRTLVSVGFVG